MQYPNLLSSVLAVDVVEELILVSTVEATPYTREVRLSDVEQPISRGMEVGVQAETA